MHKTFSVAAAVLLLVTTRVSAHHAFAAEYDAKKKVTFSGVLTKVTWDNPHAWMYVDGKDDSGKAVRWSFEMGSPNGLLNRGWKKSDLKEGEEITVEWFGAKDGGYVANASTVTLADGRKLFGGFGSTPGAPARKK